VSISVTYAKKNMFFISFKKNLNSDIFKNVRNQKKIFRIGIKFLYFIFFNNYLKINIIKLHDEFT
jgi:hypothetical protein